MVFFLHLRSITDEDVLSQEDIEMINQSSSSKVVEPEVELSQKFSQNTVNDEAGSDEDANIVSKADISTSKYIFHIHVKPR